MSWGIRGNCVTMMLVILLLPAVVLAATFNVTSTSELIAALDQAGGFIPVDAGLGFLQLVRITGSGSILGHGRRWSAACQAAYTVEEGRGAGIGQLVMQASAGFPGGDRHVHRVHDRPGIQAGVNLHDAHAAFAVAGFDGPHPLGVAGHQPSLELRHRREGAPELEHVAYVDTSVCNPFGRSIAVSCQPGTAGRASGRKLAWISPASGYVIPPSGLTRTSNCIDSSFQTEICKRSPGPIKYESSVTTLLFVAFTLNAKKIKKKINLILEL